MTGMKEGAGEDPFADDEPGSDRTGDGEDDDGIDEKNGKSANGVGGGAHPRSEDDSESDDRSLGIGDSDDRSMDEHFGENPENAGEGSRVETATETANETGSGTESGSGPGIQGGSGTDSEREMRQIPYTLRRDSVQDGRNRVPLFLQSETKTAERDALRELEDRFDDDVSLTDLREALIVVGLGRLDEVEEQLERWGYGMTFEV